MRTSLHPRAALVAAALLAGAAGRPAPAAEPGAAGPDRSARADDDTVELVAAAELIDFGYREFDTAGRELNREDGLLPGLRLTARTTRERVFARIEASFHGGRVDYDGETQSGTPARTDTGTRLFAFAAEVGGWLGAAPGRTGAFLRLARRFWDRDIESTGSVQGIHEEYRWSEVGIGLRHVLPRAEGSLWEHELAAMAFAVTDGDVFVELSGIEGVDWDDQTLALGDEEGLRLRYTATRQLEGGRALRVEPYLELWEFGRSSARTVTSGGAPADCDPGQSGFQGCAVVEPRSESRRLGVTIGLVF